MYTGLMSKKIFEWFENNPELDKLLEPKEEPIEEGYPDPELPDAETLWDAFRKKKEG